MSRTLSTVSAVSLSDKTKTLAQNSALWDVDVTVSDTKQSGVTVFEISIKDKAGTCGLTWRWNYLFCVICVLKLWFLWFWGGLESQCPCAMLPTYTSHGVLLSWCFLVFAR